MSVYVDELVDHPRTAAWPFGPSCHLLGDREDELDRFAWSIGLIKKWRQSDSALPHYDLTVAKRAAAVKRGAIELTHEQVYERILEYRKAENPQNG